MYGYVNLQSLIDKWGITNPCCKFADYTTKTFTHVGSGKSFYVKYADNYVKELLKGEWKSGNASINSPSDLY